MQHELEIGQLVENGEAGGEVVAFEGDFVVYRCDVTGELRKDHYLHVFPADADIADAFGGCR
jgi:hypothetical protein